VAPPSPKDDIDNRQLTTDNCHNQFSLIRSCASHADMSERIT
jgi:hypothetical protein